VSRPRRPLSDQQRAILDAAWEAQLEMERARQRRDELAQQAAQLGASWREIAAAVGMSPQAAHKRYRVVRAGAARAVA
jgi:hypothetical protein